jgi:hypothetical protein
MIPIPTEDEHAARLIEMLETKCCGCPWRPFFRFESPNREFEDTLCRVCMEFIGLTFSVNAECPCCAFNHVIGGYSSRKKAIRLTWLTLEEGDI